MVIIISITRTNLLGFGNRANGFYRAMLAREKGDAGDAVFFCKTVKYSVTVSMALFVT